MIAKIQIHIHIHVGIAFSKLLLCIDFWKMCIIGFWKKYQLYIDFEDVEGNKYSGNM